MWSLIERRMWVMGSSRSPSRVTGTAGTGSGIAAALSPGSAASGAGVSAAAGSGAAGGAIVSAGVVLASLEKGQDVLFADPAALAGPGDVGEVHPVFARHAPHQRRTAGLAPDGFVRGVLTSNGKGRRLGRGLDRRGNRVGGAAGSRCVVGFRRRFGCFARGPGLPFRRDPPDDGVHRHRFPLGNQDLHESPGEGGGHLGVHLVGGDVEQGIIPLDGVTDGDPPLGDRPLGDALPHLGHDDVAGHEPGILV